MKHWGDRRISDSNRRPRLKVIAGGLLKTGNPKRSFPPRTVAVASGKGGVGKTSLTVNLALALSGLGQRVLVVDGDLALGNVDALIGVHPERNLSHYLSGQCHLSDVVYPGPRGVSFLPGGSGHTDLAILDPYRRDRLVKDLVLVAGGYDMVLLDLATGIGPNAIELARRADDVLLVTTPEPVAYGDAYALMKILMRGHRVPRIVVNRVRNRREAGETFLRLSRTAMTHLGTAPLYWGHITEDPAVQEAIRRQTPFLQGAPLAPASIQVRELATRLLGNEPPRDGERLLDSAGGEGSHTNLTPAA